MYKGAAMTMTPLSTFLGGIGAGLLLAALLIRVADLSWSVVTLGAVVLIAAGTGLPDMLTRNRSSS
jgi:Na+-transporting NADH:ubiquinone oxidoreductase subunit NqrD